jgi:hypothetical protein
MGHLVDKYATNTRFLPRPDKPRLKLCKYICSRDRPRLFDQYGHQTTNVSIVNKYCFTKWYHPQTYQNFEQSRQKLGTFLVNEVLWKSKFSKNLINISWSSNQIFSTEFFLERYNQFQTLKMTLKLRILRSLTTLFIILVSLTISIYLVKKCLFLDAQLDQNFLDGL